MNKITYLALLLLAAAAFGCGTGDNRPNVILVTIDTLRADHLSCYGYARPTSPFIDSLAEQGSLFENAYGSSSWTAPSMASLFTGLYPRSHGVRHGVFQGQNTIIGQEALADGILTLAEALKQAGYRTFGVSSNGHLSRETGFDQGFDQFSLEWYVDASQVNRLANQLALPEDAPYFLWVHYFDPHGPFWAKKPWIDRYCRDAANLKELTGATAKKLRERIPELRDSPEKKQVLLALYDSEINFCDLHLRRLFKGLPGLDDSLVIVTSDHGEDFLDNDGVGHGYSLYEAEVKVPFLIRLPDGTGRARVTEPVSNLHILPTIGDYLDLDLPAALRRNSLLPLLRAAPVDPPGPVIMELDLHDSWQSAFQKPWKLVVQGTERRYSLFNLEDDPREIRDLAEERADVLGRLSEFLDAWTESHPLVTSPRVDHSVSGDQERKLRELGYLK